MTHHANRPSRRAALPALLALTLAAFAGGSLVADPALADRKKGSEGIHSTTVHNNNINKGKFELGESCDRSGGASWQNSQTGAYGCVVSGENHITVINCKKGKCKGSTTEGGPRPQ